jgi:hypothetical protein
MRPYGALQPVAILTVRIGPDRQTATAAGPWILRTTHWLGHGGVRAGTPTSARVDRALADRARGYLDMRDDSTMVAIEATLRSAAACLCGNALDIAAHDGALWLECPSFASPTRLPARLARELRALTHSRTFVALERVTAESVTLRERTLPAPRRAVLGA